ncbi:hypothetical protein CW751_00755 [Brumimicrobium salinarum]|uniref:Capsule assembly protein Wzi n=1 Tax=Brumimicrobium salinarum TaxID=2058658 RepID=A0A2I0R5P2_9FLAO|nr:hypothetical protein [Brumimicrobium salinarum]PKR81898.1 hypothetical protein CW751_00755 [Brumimicrobium salinarum]
MRTLFYISIICFFSAINAQENHVRSASVGLLNEDTFFDDTLSLSNPILPNLKSSPLFGLPIHTSTSKNKNTFGIDFFPVVHVAGALLSEQNKQYSFVSGGGFGFSGHWNDQLYARILLTGNYLESGIAQPSYHEVYKTFFLNNHNAGSQIGLQPKIRLSYTPYTFLNIQAGIDQNFIGHGKRSLLLSDYGAPYPFAQLRTQFWRIEVSNLFQFFKENPYEGLKRKFASTHFFNFKITKRFQVGIFESVVFAPKDTLMNRGYDVTYLNPFLFYRPSEYALGSQDRLLLGLNLSYEFTKFMIYGQFAIDDFVFRELITRSRWWANKYSGQLGVKGENSLQNTKMKWLIELNFARPFTYSHLNLSTNYGNQGRSLAHPLGANFVELYTEMAFEFTPKLHLKPQFFFVQQGGQDANDSLSFGADIYQPYTDRPYEYGYRIGGNGKLNRFHFSTELNYQVFEKMRIELFIRPGVEFQNGNTANFKHQFFVYGGIRSNLWNDYSFGF